MNKNPLPQPRPARPWQDEDWLKVWSEPLPPGPTASRVDRELYQASQDLRAARRRRAHT
jgi:hypothetical protein